MQTDFIENIAKIIELSDELLIYRNYRESLVYKKSKLENDLKQGSIDEKEFNQSISSLLKNRSYDEIMMYYNSYINKLIREIKLLTDNATNYLMPSTGEKKNRANLSQGISGIVSSESRKENINLDELDKKFLKKFVQDQKKIKKSETFVETGYSIYKSNFYAKISNQVMGNLTFYITNKYPRLFQELYRDISMAHIRILSKTYISIMLFTTALSLPVIFLISLLFVKSLAMAVLIAILGMVAAFFVAYFYPRTLINDRKKKIKYDLVFAIVHMSAISESGAQPVSMFKLLLESHEYKYLEPEIKKILNYVNLFGYSLSTALRAVASTTPSYELKELLNGIIATTETGGDLKKYIQDKAEDALSQYKSDQAKYTSKLDTYSDLYTGILIAAPLLFLVTLTILDKISPTIGPNLTISTVAFIGTYFIIPLLNIGFIIFLNLTKSEF